MERNKTLTTALGTGDPPFEAPTVRLPQADSMVAFSSNAPNQKLSDEVEEHKAAIPAVREPQLGLEQLGLKR